jgi:hypothetical protein
VDQAKIPDPDAVKPDDWDEAAPAQIPDEDAVKVRTPLASVDLHLDENLWLHIEG